MENKLFSSKQRVFEWQSTILTINLCCLDIVFPFYTYSNYVMSLVLGDFICSLYTLKLDT